MSTACSALYANAVRPSILHARDLGFRVMRVDPLRVRSLLAPAPVHAPQRRFIGCLQPFGFRQTLQVIRVALLRVASHDRLHGRVGLQRRRVDADRFPFQQSRLRHLSQHPAEHFLMRGLVHQPPRP
jgi:hypothetical protein